MPRILVAEVLRRYVGEVDPIVVGGATVGQALGALFERYPPLRMRTLTPQGELWSYLLLFRNGAELPREGVLDCALAPDDELEIVGAAEGGSGDSSGDSSGEPRSTQDDRDVRMRGFRERKSVAEAIRIALDGAALCGVEAVALGEAHGRVLADDLVADANVPSFRRSAMDGYAVWAEDTFGATPYDPRALTLSGESMPGADPSSRGLGGPGRAVRIMTGAPVPDGADAVLPAELAREEGAVVHAEGSVTPAKNVGLPGEDVRSGETLLLSGRRLRPQDIGILASLGVSKPIVLRRPRVAVLVSGNELMEPGLRATGSRIVDSNTPMLAALLSRDGADIVRRDRVKDDALALGGCLQSAASSGVEVLIAAGGTSVGREDFLPVLVRELGELLVHGIAMRPSSPSAIGRIGAMRVFLLPGNPVSCLAAYDVLAGPVVRRLGGLPAAMPYRRARLRVAAPISSQVGRLDYCRVCVTPDGILPIAIAGASILSSTTRADGFVLVPAQSEGYAEGATAEVHLYDVDATAS